MINLAVRKKEEMMEALRARIGDDTSDETLSFMEDFNDTFDDYERRTASTEDWEGKYNELDASWRKRYRDRFFGPEPENTETTGAQIVEDNKEDVKTGDSMGLDEVIERSAKSGL